MSITRYARLCLEILEPRDCPAGPPVVPGVVEAYPNSRYTDPTDINTSYQGIYRPVARFKSDTGAYRASYLDDLTALDSVSANFKNTLQGVYAGWTFNYLDSVPLKGTIFVKTYSALGLSIAPHLTPDMIGQSAGAILNAVTNYTPAVGETARWIQVVTTNAKNPGPLGMTENFVDTPQADKTIPFYGVWDQRSFMDAPGRRNEANINVDVVWSAEFHMVIQTGVKQVTILPNGVKWGYKWFDGSTEYAPQLVLPAPGAVKESVPTDFTVKLTLPNVPEAPLAKPTGQVEFVDDSTMAVLGRADINVVDGVATATLKGKTFSAAMFANHTVIVTHSGDEYWGYVTGTFVQQVVLADSSVHLNLPNNGPVFAGAATTLDAAVANLDGNGFDPTGTVSFYDGATFLGQGTVGTNGHAYLTTAFAAGSHSLSAVYGGDSHLTSATDVETLSVYAPSSVSGRVFNDANHNGIQNYGEQGIGGILVKLWSASGTLVATTTTAADGTYHFDIVQPGNYYLVFQKPQGSQAQWTLKDQGGNDALDSDAAANGQTDIFSLLPNNPLSHWDAGLWMWQP